MPSNDSDSLKLLLAESFEQIEKLERQLALASKNTDEDIAIVGTSCRYPGRANNLEEFWQILKTGECLIREHINQRWDAERFYSADPNAPGSIYTKSMGLLEKIDEFDAELFGITTRELNRIDPQQRILLELTWEAFENAGYAPATMLGKDTGVYVGIMNDDYAQLQGDLTQLDPYTGSGVSKSCAAGRISYNFGLQGPAISVDTACSSSLVAVHLAAQALKMRECDTAVAGGVNLILSPQGAVVGCKAQMLSPEGRCATFDEKADGYVRSEGAGLVFLKRLSDAQRDGDKIYALIKGTAINQDGRSQGLSAPNGAAQVKVIQRALAVAGVSPEDVNYVECHGTGTSLGDPIEVRALHKSYVENTDRKSPIVLGALKANVGHMESAAGIGALHKAMQVVSRKQIPQNANFTKLNPKIDVDMSNISIASVALELQKQETHYAGISSFGFSGTNVHMIIAEGSDSVSINQTQKDSGQQYIFKLSAETPNALVDYAQVYCNFLRGDEASTMDLETLCHGAAVGRHDALYRIAFKTSSIALLHEQLQEYIDVMSGDEESLQHQMPLSPSWTIDGAEYEDYGIISHLYNAYENYRNSVKESLSFTELSEEMFLELAGKGKFDDKVQKILVQAIHELALADILIQSQAQPINVCGYGYAEGLAAVIADLVERESYLRAISSNNDTLTCKIPQAQACDFISTSGNSAKPDTSIQLNITFDSRGADISENILEEGQAMLAIKNGVSITFSNEVEDSIFRWVNKTDKKGNTYELESVLTEWFMAGQPVRWSSVFTNSDVKKVALPTYPFQRERYWTDFGFIFDRDLSSTVGTVDQHANSIWQLQENEDVSKIINTILQQLFKTDKPLKQDRLLLELGIDSLMAVELINQVRSLYHVNIQISQLMGEMTINDVIEKIEQSQSESSNVTKQESVSEVVEIEI